MFISYFLPYKDHDYVSGDRNVGRQILHCLWAAISLDAALPEIIRSCSKLYYRRTCNDNDNDDNNNSNVHNDRP